MKWICAATVAAVLAVAASSSAAEEFDERMTLTIDNRNVGKVLTGRDLRRALARCNPPKTCRYVGLEREPQIYYAAQYGRDGYTIVHRSGPPGPLWDARRIGKGNRTHFTRREMIRATADYLDSRNTPFVRWKSKDLFSE